MLCRVICKMPRLEPRDIAACLPVFRGRLALKAPLAPYTWFRVGGTADVLAIPQDEEDLAYILQALPLDIPLFIMGVGSNLIVRDAGVAGVVIRLSCRAFNAIEIRNKAQVFAGAYALDAQVARVCAAAGIDGLTFLRGIPGTIGGALRMNAGAYGREIGDVLLHAVGYTRNGEKRIFPSETLGLSYRHTSVEEGVVFTGALLQGRQGQREEIEADMNRLMQARQTTQPVREKTGGSTFKNPPGYKAWQLIDSAGCRGLVVGDAQVSDLHCNFIINRGSATATDIETMGEEVRQRVLATHGIALEWEILRIGGLHWPR